MSKCQKNKYFNVGSQPCSANQNPEFQSQMSRLLAERERQDFALSAPAPSAPAPTKAATATATATTQIVLVAPKTSKPARTIDIDTILDGDA